jgi:hypothetical protein
MSDTEKRTLGGGAIGAGTRALIGSMAGEFGWGAAIGEPLQGWPAATSTTSTRSPKNPLAKKVAKQARKSQEEPVAAFLLRVPRPL